MVVCLYKLW